MKIIFFGTPEPAAAILEALIKAKHQIVGVVTQPDRPQGRGRQVAYSPVKELALNSSLLIEQPEKVKKNVSFQAWLTDLRADLAVIVAYGQILPKELLAIPKHGFINVHASLLPKYRGAAPIQWALLNGEKETGITIMKIGERLDAGEIILQRKLSIEEKDNAETLSHKLFAIGQKALLQALQEIETGQVKLTPQIEGEATFAPSLTKESGEIDWRKSAVEINNRIRALVPWPTAHTYYQNQLLKLWRAEVLPDKKRLPGEVVDIVKKAGFSVSTGQGDLLVLEVQLEGKKRMSAFDFAIGHDVKIGDKIPS
jgi:methionyl-tRNA formyltransferase